VDKAHYSSLRESCRLSFLQLALIAIFCLVPVSPVRAGDAPKEPVLRIETGMHTAVVAGISLDRTNRFLATASYDKTARVWDLKSGRLLRVLRPPIGTGHEGELYAVALSPDAHTVACGGWTGGEWDGTQSIYLFNRENGHLVRRLTGLPDQVFRLAFSADGNYLLAALSGGVRLYRTSDYAEIGQDAGYEKPCYGAAFIDKSGRVVTSCLDGFLRLYDPVLKLRAKIPAHGGKMPWSLAVSPDSSRVAVAFEDKAAVDVYATGDLSYLFSADTSGTNGVLHHIVWMDGGQTLAAAGTYIRNGNLFIRRWGFGGKGAGQDVVSGAHNTILDLQPLADGRLAFGSLDPAFGILDVNGRQPLVVSSDVVAFQNQNWEMFRVSGEGTSVQFAYNPESAALFSVLKRTISLDPGSTAGLAAPTFTAEGLDVSLTDNMATLNGTALGLPEDEPLTSFAVAPDKNSFIIGTGWSLYRFDRKGAMLWRVMAPVALRVNVSGNGRLAVAACNDGTIRWYRLSDGKELLAFFPHKDRKRWVAWSPAGYYDASPGGEDLIGWQVNRGKDRAADFFPASRFRSSYYRPTVIAKILTTLDVAEAVRAADQETGRVKAVSPVAESLPPLVTILDSAEDGISTSTRTVTLRYQLTTPADAPITAVRTLVDGRPVPIARGVSIGSDVNEIRELSVTVPEQDCEISILAENRHAPSVAAVVRVHWQGKVRAAPALPKLFLVSVGVSDYRDQSLKLAFAAKDAADFAAVLKQQEGLSYSKVTAMTLTDSGATREGIMRAFKWLKEETTTKDVGIIFLAGHGVDDPAGIYYFLPPDANRDNLEINGVAFSDIRNTVASLSGKVLLFVDTCHAGNVLGGGRFAADMTVILNTLAGSENGVVVFASSTGSQNSLEDEEWHNGAFTKALVEGLSGKADYGGTGTITVTGLDHYVSGRVAELTGKAQTPVALKPLTVPDFPVASKR